MIFVIFWKVSLNIFINIWFSIRKLNIYILYAERLFKGMQATQNVKWNECTNEKMTWNTQDTNLSWYVPKADVDHAISGPGTAISTLDHSATTPRAIFYTNHYWEFLWHLFNTYMWLNRGYSGRIDRSVCNVGLLTFQRLHIKQLKNKQNILINTI